MKFNKQTLQLVIKMGFFDNIYNSVIVNAFTVILDVRRLNVLHYHPLLIVR